MWADAQRDGRSAEYRWRLVRKYRNSIRCTTPQSLADRAAGLLECRAVTLRRRETPLKFAGVPQTRQRISAVSRPKFTILSERVEEIMLFNKFFPVVDTCLSSEDMARQSCAMVPKWRFFCVLYFQRAACRTFQTCILNSH